MTKDEALEKKAQNARDLGLDYEPMPTMWERRPDGKIGTTNALQRTWVGLTDEEIETIYAECNVWDKFEYERMLEAKIKEKNT